MKSRVLGRLGVDVVIQRFSPGITPVLRRKIFLPYLQRRLPDLAALCGEWRLGPVGKRERSPAAGRSGTSNHVVGAERSAHPLERRATISSTRIRDSLEAGRLEEANMLLGYSYFAEGVVTPGRQLGRTIGFPTLNLAWKPELKPRYGVYAVRVAGDADGGPALPAVANYGLRPTVGKRTRPCSRCTSSAHAVRGGSRLNDRLAQVFSARTEIRRREKLACKIAGTGRRRGVFPDAGTVGRGRREPRLLRQDAAAGFEL